MTDVDVPRIVIEMPTPVTESFNVEDAPKQPAGRGITVLTVEIPIPMPPPSVATRPRPAPRWNTPEFIFYGCVFITVVPLLLKIPMDLSQESHPNFHLYQHRLSQGWIGGRKVDNSDHQYRTFRNNVPALLLLSIGHVASGKIYNELRRVSTGVVPSQLPFNLVFSLAMLLGLHGASALKILAIFSLNYALAKSLGGKGVMPFAVWGFNVAILFLNEIHDGYRFASIHSSLDFLDSYQGFYPRWAVTFNITILRLISFAMDYHWAILDNRPQRANDLTLEKERIATRHATTDYNYYNYIAYAAYPPLYIAGPIMTFNNFLWQMRQPLRIPFRAALGYGVRFLVCFFTMELVLHYMYVVAIKDAKAWRGDSPAQLSLVGFWNLIVVWLKLLIPWRFFRLWALCDGVDPPENMVRCMANNYSVFGFWKSWHRSYNLWIVRYLYIPVGGAKRRILATLLVFTFVALWHDLSFKLLAWGWLISLFVLPELAATKLLPEARFRSEGWYRHVCALGAVINILMMMGANLVGFVVGLDGARLLIHEIFGTWEGVQFLLFACGCLFIGAQVMFEYREEEMRRGIFRRF